MGVLFSSKTRLFLKPIAVATAAVLGLLTAHALPPFSGVSGLTAAQAQDRPKGNEPGHLYVRRMRRTGDPNKPYWEGFELKNSGDCESAIEHLQPIAHLGRGYEEAQHALGVCLMQIGGLSPEPGAAPKREILTNDFNQGLTWVQRAAEAGSFSAQRTVLALYAARLGPDQDLNEAAKWLHLYKVNPIRLGLGADLGDDEPLQQFETSLSPAILLEGKNRARRWMPSFWRPSAVPPANG